MRDEKCDALTKIADVLVGDVWLSLHVPLPMVKRVIT